MNQSLSSRAPRPFVALLTFAALALGACNDRPDATQPVPQTPSRLITCGDGCGSGGGGGSPPPPPPPPTITSLSLPNSTLSIEGASMSYTATLSNSGPTRSGVVAQGYIVQGSARRAAGGTQVNCGAGTGVLPTGTCQISFTVVAGNSLQGSGTLVPGGATFELDLTAGSSTTTRTTGVNLIANVTTTSLRTLSLSGAPGDFNANTQGGSQTVSGLSYQMTVIQGQVHRSAGSAPLTCFGGFSPAGTLPANGFCLTPLAPVVTVSADGSNILLPGPATFQVSLLQGSTVLSTKSWPITIINARFLDITPSVNPMRIGGGSQLFTASIYNASDAIGNVRVNAYVKQPTGSRSTAIVAPISCGYGSGYLPIGSCVIIGSYAADTNVFFHTITPGPATLTLELTGQDSASFLIATIDVPITLVSLPTISTVTPTGTPNINVFGTVAGYTATITNPGPAISNATMMVKIFQDNVVRQGIPSPVSIDCGSGAGTLPTGTCTFNGLYSASNTAPGSGTLVPGPATLEIELSDPANGTVSTKYVAITLLGS
jgi:hypothetical protein